MQCKTPNCNIESKAKGYCGKCYNRFRKYGNTTFPVKKIKMITIQCRQCKKFWQFYPKFLESTLFYQELRQSYEVCEGKKTCICSRCQELNKI